MCPGMGWKKYNMPKLFKLTITECDDRYRTEKRYVWADNRQQAVNWGKAIVKHDWLCDAKKCDWSEIKGAISPVYESDGTVWALTGVQEISYVSVDNATGTTPLVALLSVVTFESVLETHHAAP